MNKKPAIIIILSLVMIGIAWIGYDYYTSRPEYSLLQIQKAIDNGDVLLFEEYVDLDGTLSKILDQAWSNVSKGQDENDGWSKIGNIIGGGLLQVFKPGLIQELKKKALQYVKNGEMKPSQSSDNQIFNEFEQNAAQLFDNRCEFKGIAYTRNTGSLVLVGLELFYPEKNKTFIFELKMKEAGKHWKLVEISNFDEILKELETNW